MSDKAKEEDAPESEGLERADTLMGDVRDRFLAIIQELAKPWSEMAESDQRWLATKCENLAQRMIYETIEIVHAEGAPSIRMVVGKVGFGKGVSATLTAAKTEQERHRLADLADGAEVIVVMDDMNKYLGEREKAKTDPDQRDIENAIDEEKDDAPEDEDTSEADQ